MARETTLQGRNLENNDNVVKLQRRKRERTFYPGDFGLLVLVLGLVIFGVVMVFSASYYYAIGEHGNPNYYLKRDAVYALLGIVAMMILTMTDYHALSRFSAPLLAVSFLMLLVIQIPPLHLGMELNNATRWMKLGPITIMPGEIAKPACILFVSTFLSSSTNRVLDLKQGVLPVLGVLVVFCGLILVQPNLSTMITLALIILGIMFIAGIRRSHLTVIALAGAAAMGVYFLMNSGNYQSGRIRKFWDPFSDPSGSGYQVSQGLLAFGSGGPIGTGLGQSIQKKLYLPEPQNDFILAIIGEELGFVGVLALFTVYLLLIWRCVRIAIKAPDMLGTLIASGITIMLAVHVVLNVMVVTAMMPPTGVILPFISWGGNALIIFIGCMGIMMNISRQRLD